MGRGSDDEHNHTKARLRKKEKKSERIEINWGKKYHFLFISKFYI